MPAPKSLRRDPRALARALVDAFGKNRLLTYASAVAFRTLVALIPLTLLGIALLGATGQQHVWNETLAPGIEQRVEAPVFSGIDSTVQSIFQQGGGLLIAFAAVLCVLDVSSSVRAIMSSLNEIDATRETRSTVVRFVVSFALGAVVIAGLVGAVLLVTAGGRLAGTTGGVLHVAFGMLRWVAALALLTLTIALVVRFGGVAPHSKRWITQGTVAIVLAWAVMSVAFKWSVASFANYKTGPGILFAFLILTTYVYASAIVFLVGVQLDALLGDG